MKKRVFFLSILLLSLSACKPTFEVPDASAGEMPVSSYAAIGSSYTAGFADGALSKEGQAASYPVLLASRFKDVGGGVFNVPYLIGDKGVYPDPLASNVFNTLSRLALKLVVNCKGEEMLLPKRISDTGDDDIKFDDPSHRIYTTGNIYHHFGIPGMKSMHVFSLGYAYDGFFEVDMFNPFYWRFASQTIYGTVLQDVMAAKPAFYTLEIGMTDVLNYAIDGGKGKTDGTLKPDLTPAGSFASGLKSVLDSLQSIGAKGILTNIPHVLDFPYFTKIEYNALNVDAAKAAELTALYSAQGFSFSEGKNPFVINDNGTIRQMRSTEFITLKTPVDSLKCADWGASVPLADEYILTDDEIALVVSYTQTYNNLLNQEASARGIPVLDLRDFFQKLSSGITINGIELSCEFVKGGFFSLDGLHPNPRGQAMLANEFLKVINSKFAATLPYYDITGFQGTVFP